MIGTMRAGGPTRRRLLGAALAAGLGTLALPAPAQDRPFDPDAAIARYGFADDQVGYIVFDPRDGAVLAERNADRPFIPASVSKIPTTVAALGVLGPEYRFETALLADGHVAGGRLHGDLYLRGGGDPVLDSDDLVALARGLRSQGITGVTGALVYDAGLLASVSAIDPLQPLSASYNTGVSALSLNFNIIQVQWRRSGAGAYEVSATTNTDTMRVPVDSVTFAAVPAHATAGGFYVHRHHDEGEHWGLSPALPAQGHDWLPLHDPARNTAMVFRRIAADHGIALGMPRAGAAPPGARVVARHHSRPLAEIVRGVLRYSNNLSAELIGMVASQRLTGRALSLADSGATLGAWLQQRLPGEDWRGYVPANHSGLSSDARMTPRQMAAILRLADGRTFGAERYDGLLHPVAWGGAAGQGAGHGAAVAVRAKSGTMYYARGLAGFIDGAAGRRLGFAVFVSDPTARRILDAAPVHARTGSAAARNWLARARELERTLVGHWATAY